MSFYRSVVEGEKHCAFFYDIVNKIWLLLEWKLYTIELLKNLTFNFFSAMSQKEYFKGEQA